MTAQQRATRAVELLEQDCDHCGQTIVWADTVDARMPLDAKPVDGGNVLVIPDAQGVLISTMLNTLAKRNAYAAQGWSLYTHHKLSCPRSGEWSKPGRRKPPPPRRRDATITRGRR